MTVDDVGDGGNERVHMFRMLVWLLMVDGGGESERVI